MDCNRCGKEDLSIIDVYKELEKEGVPILCPINQGNYVIYECKNCRRLIVDDSI